MRWLRVVLARSVLVAAPFFERLKTYLSEVGKVLKGEADVASVFPNAADIGTSRERVYAEFLRQHLPKGATVTSGGFLFDMEGNESKQIDLIVLNDVSPQFNFHNPEGQGKSFACIDGCVAVGSIKSTLNSGQLVDALDNIASLPDKAPLESRHHPLVTIRNYEDWPYKVAYASDGMAMNAAINTINTFYEDNGSIPYHKRPNIVHVCGKYNIVRVGKDATTRGGAAIEENTFWGNPDTSDAYALLATVLGIQARLLSSNQVFYMYQELVNRLPM
jgi:hypothetical protein